MRPEQTAIYIIMEEQKDLTVGMLRPTLCDHIIGHLVCNKMPFAMRSPLRCIDFYGELIRFIFHVSR